MTKRKLLFVDDEPDFVQLIEQEFEDKIDDYDITFLFAENGLEALKKLDEHQDVELVLIDINMPVMDGLEFVAQATKLDRLLKIIMVSAYSDMSNLRKAMNRGAYDFIIKPVDFVDLKETIKKAFKHIDQIKAEEAELRRLQEIEKEMEITKKILATLLPSSVTPFFQSNTFEVFGTVVAARMMGGDFYDFFPAGSNLLAVVVGETEAKGVAAAIYIASAREAIRRFCNQNPDFAQCIKQINDYLFYQKTKEIPSFSLFLGIFNTATGEFSYTYSGLPPLLLVSEKGEITEQILSNPLMGSSLNENHAINQISLKKNESCMIHSKGIYKIQNKGNQKYSEDRFKELISTNHSLPLANLVDNIIIDVRNFIQPNTLIDDYVLLCLKFKGF